MYFARVPLTAFGSVATKLDLDSRSSRSVDSRKLFLRMLRMSSSLNLTLLRFEDPADLREEVRTGGLPKVEVVGRESRG